MHAASTMADRGRTGDGLRVTGIVRRFGATLALDGVDVLVRPGEVHALIGENNGERAR